MREDPPARDAACPVGAAAAPSTEAPPAPWVELCRLLERAGSGAYTLRPAGETGDPDMVLVGNAWALAGGDSDRHRVAAAEILAVVRRSEEEIESLCREIVERYEEVGLVYRLTEKLASTLGERAIAACVLADAASVIGARFGQVWLRGAEGLFVASTYPEEPQGLAPSVEEATVTAFQSGRPHIVDAASDHEAVVALPLPAAEGEPIGVLTLRGRSGGRSFGTVEIKLLTALATLTGAFIRNSRLAEQVRLAEAREREDEIARQVHRGLLPHADPEVEGLRIRGGHRAAENVGGDYYGYIALPDGSLGIAAADVSGHGVGAALYMAAAKGSLQSEARRSLSPSDLLRRVNEVLVADFSESDVFATAFYARFHAGGRRFEFCNAGHNPPLLVRADGEVERLGRGGTALGVLRAIGYREDARDFFVGDVLIVYTDGLVEARDSAGAQFGMERLTQAAIRLRGLDASWIHRSLLEELARHCGGSPPKDDVTLVVVKAVSDRAEGEQP